MFGQEIGRILGAGNLRKGKVAALQPVLDPQVGNMEVSNLSQTAASANTDGRGRIGEKVDFQRYPQIHSNRLETQ